MHDLEIPGVEGDTYNLSADDIGADVVCQAVSADGIYRGGGVGVLGPVRVDPITRMSLERLIASGVGPFPVRHHRSLDDPHPRDLMLRVTQESVKVVHPGAMPGQSEVVVSYRADYPKVVLHPVNNCKFRLELSEDSAQCYHFVALSRSSRDLIALMIRTFHSRQYVATTFLLSQMTQNPAAPSSPALTIPKQAIHFNVPALNERLVKELHRNVLVLLSLERSVTSAEKEKAALQEQLRETINSYTDAIEQMHQQIASVKGGPGDSLQLQLHDARAVYSRLQLEMQELKPQLEEAQLLAAGAGSLAAPPEHQAETAAVKGDIANLRASITALAHSSRSSTEARSAEVQKLRQDIEVLTKEKDELLRCAKQADADKRELIENFLYIKGALDKLQMASLQAFPAQPEVEREIGQLKVAYDQSVDERNRLAVRIEALERDREKSKGSRESAVERMMTVNSKLLEERDQLEREKARISDLYAGVVESAGTKQPAGPSLEELQAELAQKSAMLEAKQKETESLRSRLRKLATV